MTSKAKMIGAAVALGLVGVIGGASVIFADDLDQAMSATAEGDETDANSFFVRFGLAAPRPVVVAPRAHVVAPARRWVPGYWHGWRYHRGYWR